MTKLIIFIILFSDLFVGIMPNNNFIKTKWKMISINDGIKNKAYDFRKVDSYLTFTDTMFYIVSCNSTFGKYTNDKETNKIKILFHNVTDPSCYDEYSIINSYIEKYFSNMTYHINLDTLVLYNIKGVTFKYIADK